MLKIVPTKICAQSTTLTPKYAGSAISGMTTTDSSLATGNAGIYFSTSETSASVDNWEGGDFAAAGGGVTYPELEHVTMRGSNRGVLLGTR